MTQEETELEKKLAKIVPRAWIEADFKQRLINDATATLKSAGLQPPAGQSFTGILLSGPNDNELAIQISMGPSGQPYYYGKVIYSATKPTDQIDVLEVVGSEDEVTPEQTLETSNNPVKVGGIVPGGGIIFFVDSTGRHGLEARPATEVREMNWNSTSDFVATLNRTFGPGWRLPTIEELQLLYKQKDTVGGFERGYFHWSSTEVNSGSALSLVDKTGGVHPLRKGGDTCYVRAIRTFSPNDLDRMEPNEVAIAIKPHERIGWSKHWQYNHEKLFSKDEKDDILELVRTTALTPHPTIGQGFTAETDKFSVFLYFAEGVWEINGATKAEAGGLRDQEIALPAAQSPEIPSAQAVKSSSNSGQRRKARDTNATASTKTRTETSVGAPSVQSQTTRSTKSRPWWRFWS